MTGKKSWLVRLAGYAVAALVLFFLVRQLVVSWPAIGAHTWHWRWPYLLVSLALTQLGYFALARAWRSVLRAIQVPLRLRTAYWVFLVSNLGRYLPGKFWQIAGAAMLGRRIGLSGTDVAASMIVYQFYLIPTGALLVLLGGSLPEPFDTRTFGVLAWAFVGLCAAAALWPHRILRAGGGLVRRAGVEPERWRLALRRRVAISVQCAFAWACLGTGFGFFVLSVTPVALAQVPFLARTFVAAYLIGYLALISPGGLGVREGSLAVLLKRSFGAGPASGIALLSRIWITVSELIALVPALVWARQDRFGRRDLDAAGPERSAEG